MIIRRRDAAATGLFGVALVLSAPALAQANAGAGIAGPAEHLPPPRTPQQPTTTDASPSDAAGQGTQLPSAGDTQEIVVTAQFREQNLQRTPIAITALSADMLARRGQVSIADITNEAPNVTLKPGAAPYGPSLQAFIRGVGQYDFNFAEEPGVGMYVDDVYYSTLTGSIFDLLDLDRVEVLRGPQGTLAGMNSIGGSIKLYSKKPEGNDGGYLQASYGSYHHVDVRGSADLTLVPGTLFARVAGVSNHQDGYVTRYDYACTHPGTNVPSMVQGSDCKLGTEGGKAYNAIRASLRWTPTSRLSVDVIGDYTNDKSEASPFTLLYVGQANGTTGTATQAYPRFSSAPINGIPLGTSTGSAFITYSPFGNYSQDSFTHSPYANYSTYGDLAPADGTAPFNQPSASRVSGWGFSANASYELSDALALRSITAYRRYTAEFVNDEDASPLSDQIIFSQLRHRQFSEELRLTGNLNNLLYFALGGFYFDQRGLYGARADTGSMDFIEDDTVPANSKAVFANLDWHVTDKLELSGGLRYTKEEKTFRYGRLGVAGNNYPPCAAAGGAPVSPAICSLNGVVGRFSGDHVDYRAAVQYQWTPHFMTYADVSTGFKGGGVNPRPFYPSQALPFAPETLRAYEAGFKSELFDRRLRLNVAAFYNDYHDIQLIVSQCNLPGVPVGEQFPCAAILNAGNAHVKGVEMEAQARPVDRLSIDATASYLAFNYTRLSPAAAASGITTDMTTPFAPSWKYNVGVQYEVPLGQDGSLTPRVDVSYQSAFYSVANNSTYNKVPGYTLLNASLILKPADTNWQLALSVQNLTNKLYYFGYFDNRGSSQTVMGEPAPPREWTLSIRRNF